MRVTSVRRPCHNMLTTARVYAVVMLALAASGKRRVLTLAPSSGPPAPVCSSDKLAHYEVHFSTYWSNRTFPKQYPNWRPNAQWTKLLGMSHAPDHVVFRVGETASHGFLKFAEEGDTDLLERGGGGQDDLVLDTFSASPIPRGVGFAAASFFVDANHSVVSMVSKIVPSPDWFVGVDSLQLCSNTSWLNATSLQLSPLDAGTDQGFSFSSPNWRNAPLDTIQRISNTSPGHPAGSFNYPNLKALPVIASLSIVKTREYSLVKPRSTTPVPLPVVNFKNIRRNEKTRVEYSRKFGNKPQATNVLSEQSRLWQDSPSSDARSSTVLSGNRWSHNTKKTTAVEDAYEKQRVVSRRNDKSSMSKYKQVLPREQYDTNELHDNKRKRFKAQQRKNTRKSSRITTNTRYKSKQSTIRKSTEPEEPGLKSVSLSGVRQDTSEPHIPVGDAMSVIDAILERYQLDERRKKKYLRRKERRLRRLLSKRTGLPQYRDPRAVDCVVGEWTDWSACTKRCGIGEQVRQRSVVTRAQRGGRKCPTTTETTWCGSARNCKTQADYFRGYE